MESDYFTFDPEKDRLNLLKHGLSLLHGVDVYLSPDKLTLISLRLASKQERGLYAKWENRFS
jgi:uncharacterized DUF497 family protein